MYPHPTNNLDFSILRFKFPLKHLDFFCMPPYDIYLSYEKNSIEIYLTYFNFMLSMTVSLIFLIPCALKISLWKMIFLPLI